MKLHFLLTATATSALLCASASPIVAVSESEGKAPIELGGTRLRLATKKVSSTATATAPFTLSETCGIGSYTCFGEGTIGGDYQGPKIIQIQNEVGVVKFLEGSKFGVITVDITANEDTPNLVREFEICRPDPLNGEPESPFPKYYCVTTVRNDEPRPTVLIDMTFHSCNSWSKIVRNLAANSNKDGEAEPGVFEVRCTKDETTTQS